MAEPQVAGMVTALSLTSDESLTLEQLETAITRGFGVFVEVGNALLRIRDERLYRATHRTFEDYCRERWQMSRPRAYELIRAAETVGEMSAIADIPLPANESQVRPLTRLPADERAAAWEEAVNTAPDGRMTAAHVAATVERRLQAEAEDEYDDTEWKMPPDFARLAPMPERSPLAVHYSSESPEWNTPASVLALVERVMGAIDLDPCSNDGIPNVDAATHYTAAEDGLSRPWDGRVYMNPPYGDAIGQWVRKLKAEYDEGNTVEAIALVPARTDTAWFQSLWDFPICFVRGRLKFGGAENSAPFPSAVIYLGDDGDRFVEVFRAIGPIVGRLD